MPISIEATLTRLRNEFITMLPSRIDMLEQQLLKIAHGEKNGGAMLAHAAHSLVGAAGVHRLMDISAAARKLETVAVSLPAEGRVDEPKLFALHKALAKLAAAAENPVHGFLPSPAAARQPPLVLVVGTDADRTLWLRSVLEEAGYRVEVIGRPDDCATASWNGDRPATLILDLDSLGNDTTAAKPVADLKTRCFPGAPLIFLSARHDFESKLAAYRAGATRYLTTPLNREALIRSLSGSEKLASPQAYRVLLVDDDPDQLAAQSLILRKAGMEVRETDNPLDAPDLLDGFAAEVVLLDMDMPQCSGPELAAILRGDGRHELIPVVYLSVEPGASPQYSAFNQGADYLLAKPVDAHHLTTVASLCAKRYRQTQERVEILRATLYERERQQHALDAHAIVSITDSAGNILYANDKFCEVSGYSRHELIGNNHRIVKSSMHSAELYTELWQTIARGLIWHGELCNRRKNGSHYWVETTIVPFLDDEGLPYQYISVRTDITHVKEAEQRLARSQTYANIGTWDWNIETGDLFWSERIAPLFGHAEGSLETTYENFLAAVHPDDRQKVADAVKACVEQGAEYDIEHRVVWPDGSVHWLLERGDVVRDAAGTPLHMLGVVQDITERKFAEMALEASQRLARLGNWRVDLATGNITWSKEVYVLFDRSPNDFAPTLPRYYAELCHPDDVDKVQQTQRRLLDTPEPERVDHRILWPDGSVRWMHLEGYAERDAAGTPVAMTGMVQDITERKLTEMALEESRKRLEEAQHLARLGDWTLDIKTGEITWSAEMYVLCNRAPDTYIPTLENLYSELVHPDDGPALKQVRQLILETQERQSLDHRLLWPDGTVRWVHVDASGEFDNRSTLTRMVGTVQDITERKLAEMALEAAQRLARLGNWKVDLATGRITWSKEVYILLNRSPDDYVPTLAAYYAEITHPDDVGKVQETQRLILEYAGPQRVDHRILWPDGTVRWVHLEGYAERNASGTPVAMTGMMQDITERKHTEMALEEAQRLSRVGHWELDIRTGKKTWSDQLYVLCNRTPETYTPTLEKYYSELIHPDDIRAAREIERLIVESRELQSFDHRILWPDGTVRWVHLDAYAEYNADGEAVRMIGTAQDITERKRIEMALEESRKQLEEAQSLAKLGYWTADMTTGALQWSDEIYRIFGLDPAQFTPSVETFERAVHPDDWEHILASERRAAETGVHDVVHRIVRPDGEVRYVHELAHARVGANGQLLQLAGTVQDVTELKQTEHAMLQAKEAAEAASRAKSEFLASMSHELRTPLNSILGFAQLFALDPKLPPHSTVYAHEIERAGQHLLSLVNDLIDLARIEAGKLDLFPVPVSTKAVVADSLAMVAPIARDRGIQLINAGGSGKDTVVMADSTRLQQVLINLLSNAIKYNRPSGTVHIACHAEGGATRIAITDNGPGIPAEKQARMFSAFDRLGAERGQVEGSGIGLVITRRIIEAMGGSIGFESAEGRGSTFWVSLPVTTAAAHAASAPSAPDMAILPAARAYVLYIEDNPMNQHLMQQVFATHKSLELRTTHTAEIGIQLARVEAPALIMMDINLPGMDGYAALQVLRADPATANVPVVAVTANAMKGDEKRGLKAGFDAYLTKPIDLPELFKVVNKLTLGTCQQA